MDPALVADRPQARGSPALVGPLTCVCPHVAGHALRPLEGTPAQPAPVHLVGGVPLPVVALLVAGLLVVVGFSQVFLCDNQLVHCERNAISNKYYLEKMPNS